MCPKIMFLKMAAKVWSSFGFDLIIDFDVNFLLDLGSVDFLSIPEARDF